MIMKEKKNSEHIASGLSAAAGSLSGTVGAKAALNHTAGTENSSNEEVSVLDIDEPYDTGEEPDIIEDVYGGPIPDIEPMDPYDEPILCIYGPPEPEIYPDFDIDNPTDDLPIYK